MNRRSVAIVWLFALTLIAGSCAITFYTAKLSLELATEQENFKRSSISALVQNEALKELSIFEDVIYAATIKLDADQASREMLNRVEWITQVDHFAYSENSLERSTEFSLPKSSANGIELDQVTKAILFESSNKLNSRLIYLNPLSPIKQSSIMTAGLSLKKTANNEHFIIYLDLNGLLEKITTNLQPLASISLEHSGNKEPSSNSWAIQIPNLDIHNFKNIKSKIIIFEQDLYYYKFNLLCNRIKWYGTRAIKKKNLINFEWLRQIKPKKYSFYRIDTIFKKDKYIDLKILKDGGWHFTRVISPEEIHKKELDAEHHDEYRASNKNPERIKDLIKRRMIDHDHLADTRENKYGKEFALQQLSLEKMPSYIRENQDKYKDFLDLD